MCRPCSVLIYLPDFLQRCLSLAQEFAVESAGPRAGAGCSRVGRLKMACLLETPIRMSVLSVSDPLQPPTWELGSRSQHSPKTQRVSWAPPLRVASGSALGRGVREGGRE